MLIGANLESCVNIFISKIQDQIILLLEYKPTHVF